MKTWQIFDSEGKVSGSVMAQTIADACRKVREYGIDFPILVEMPKDVAISIQQLVEKKTSLELFIAGTLEEHIEKFESNTGVPIQNVEVKMLEKDPDTSYTIFVNVELDLNNIK